MHRSLIALLAYLAASVASSQDYTPAPVDLTGAPGLSGVSDGMQVYVDLQGEVFYWNSGPLPFQIDGYSLACSENCLDPSAYVSVSAQAVVHVTDYVAAYGPQVFSFGGLTPNPDNVSGLSINGGFSFPAGPEFAMSLGKVIDGELAQIRDWVDSGVLTFHYASARGISATPPEAFQVAPEPSALMLAASFAGVCLVVRRFRRDKAA